MRSRWTRRRLVFALAGVALFACGARSSIDSIDDTSGASRVTDGGGGDSPIQLSDASREPSPVTCAGGKISCDGGCCDDPCGDMSGLQAGAPWPMAARCPELRRLSTNAGPDTNAPLWSFNINGEEAAEAVVGNDGAIYLATDRGDVLKVSPAGSLIAKHSVVSPVYSSPVLGRDGTVYVANSYALYALSPSLEEKWSVVLDPTEARGAPYTYWSPAIGPDGLVYASPIVGGLRAVAPAGTVAWSLDSGADFSSPAVDEGHAYVIASGAVYALDSRGNVSWSRGAASAPGLMVGRNHDIYASANNELTVFHPDGGVARTDSTFRGYWLTFAQGNTGISYVGAGANSGVTASLAAVEPSGHIAWTDTSFSAYGPCDVDRNEQIYCLAYQIGYDWSASYVVAYRPDGTEKWRVPVGSEPTGLAMGDHVLYVSSGSQLIAIGP